MRTTEELLLAIREARIQHHLCDRPGRPSLLVSFEESRELAHGLEALATIRCTPEGFRVHGVDVVVGVLP